MESASVMPMESGAPESMVFRAASLAHLRQGLWNNRRRLVKNIKMPKISFKSPILIPAAFIVANIIKITVFNGLLIPEHNAGFVAQKLLMTSLMAGILYPVFYLAGSRALVTALYFLQAGYIAVNITYYLYFHTYLHPAQAAALLSEAFSTAANSAVPLDWRILTSVLDLPPFIGLINRMGKLPRPSKRQRHAALVIVAASFVAFTTVEFVRHAENRSFADLVKDTYSGETPLIEGYGTFGANLVSLAQSVVRHPWEEQLEYGGLRTAAATGRPAPNFVIIQVESMDSGIVNQKYRGAYVTPYLHSLAGSAVYYPFALSYHKGGGTSDSEFSILNSMEPLDCYPALKLPDYGYPNSLVASLKKSGYATLAFHGNRGSFYNRDAAFPRLGFSEFFDMAKTGLPENGWGLPDADVFSFACETLRQAEKPFFAYVITMSSHEPFDSVYHYYRDPRFEGVRDKTVKNYFNSMSYVDKSLEAFVQEIRAGYGDTFIIITGDHAPNILKDEYRQASFNDDNRFFEFVPLMIITPEGSAYRESSKAASFLDIAPTVLEASGAGGSLRTNGKNLLDRAEAGGPIPYRGGAFDRTLLFKKALKSMSNQ